jgi:hypothetical protein
MPVNVENDEKERNCLTHSLQQVPKIRHDKIRFGATSEAVELY